MSERSPAPDNPRPGSRRLRLAAPNLLAVWLVTLAFSASAEGAGASAMGWGNNNYGQAGNGMPTETGCQCLLTPTPVSGLSDATQISGGTGHAIALHDDGTVTAWGYNGLGMLGNGTTSESATPVSVSGLSNVVAVDAGYEHNLALLADGTVMAWGANEQGELGVGGSDFSGGGPTCGTHACSDVPIPVPGLSNVVAIQADYYYSAALLADGTVMAWGYDRWGELGDGAGILTGCECQERPVPVPGVSGAMDISLGEDHGIALLGNGTLTAWGENAEGQVGNGTNIEAPAPACFCVGAVGVNGLSGAVGQISAGSYHSLALLGGGSLQAWGYNGDGEVGNGVATTTGCQCIPSPTAVAELSGVQRVAAGGYHTLALLGDGSLRAWGYNFNGQLGDGTEDTRSAPVPVTGLSGVSDVSTGEYISFALIGPSHGLTVALAGAGAGTVGGPDGIICPVVNCASRLPDSQVEILRAEAAPGSGFAGFTGPCTGTGPCQVKMDSDKTVTATFGPPKGTKINRAKIKQGKKPKKGAKRKPKARAKATFSFATPGVVTGYQCMLVKPKAKPKRRQSKRMPLARGRRAKPRFVKCSSPKRYKKLKKGRYTFKVRARNALGVEAKPAIRKFRIRR